MMKFITVGILGLLIGIGLFNLEDHGYFSRWHELQDSSYRDLDPLIAENWQADDRTRITKPCDHSSPEFSFLSNEPDNIADCVQIYIQYVEGANRYAYVLDTDGSIWEWSSSTYAYDQVFKMVCFPTLGCCIGIMIAGLIHRSQRKKRRSISQPDGGEDAA